jgi:hypothetical protein
MESTAASSASPVRRRKVPDYLVKEEIDGIKFYFRGYKQVLNKTKSLQDIMGCSSLQSFLVEYLLTLFIEGGAQKRYRVFTNESGNHLALHNNLQFDIALYDKNLLTADKITRCYVQSVPPRLVIEVDMDVELEDSGLQTMEEFVLLKTGKLIEFGTHKIIWILSKSKKVVVAEAGKTWTIHDWNEDLELLDNIRFNIGQYLLDEGVNPETV